MSPVVPGPPLEQPTCHDGLKELDQETLGFGTRAIHVGSEPDPNTGAIIPAISLSTTYKQEDLVGNKGFVYSRLGNPNRHALERTLASLESGAASALTFASGSAATATVIQSLGHDAHIVSVNDVYGGTSCYMTRVAKEGQGLETTFLDLENADEGQINAALRDNTKVCLSGLSSYGSL
jgi:cystathionine gamma-lyase